MDSPGPLAAKIIPGRHVFRAGWDPPRPLVFTNGVFDVLHPGHVAFLEAARDFGRTLLVGVNTDASARKLGKQPRRPLNPQQDRTVVLAALQSVSYVVLFDESTPCELLEECRPDVYVKGADYDMEVLEETRLVRSWGGRSLAIPLRRGYSTTDFVRRVLQGT